MSLFPSLSDKQQTEIKALNKFVELRSSEDDDDKYPLYDDKDFVQYTCLSCTGTFWTEHPEQDMCFPCFKKAYESEEDSHIIDCGSENIEDFFREKAKNCKYSQLDFCGNCGLIKEYHESSSEEETVIVHTSDDEYLENFKLATRSFLRDTPPPSTGALFDIQGEFTAICERCLHEFNLTQISKPL